MVFPSYGHFSFKILNLSIFSFSEFAVLVMVRGGRLKVTGASVVWINLILLGLLEKEHMGKCTKPRTKIQVKVATLKICFGSIAVSEHNV